jgi:hypothetical protein
LDFETTGEATFTGPGVPRVSLEDLGSIARTDLILSTDFCGFKFIFSFFGDTLIGDGVFYFFYSFKSFFMNLDDLTGSGIGLLVISLDLRFS